MQDSVLPATAEEGEWRPEDYSSLCGVCRCLDDRTKFFNILIGIGIKERGIGIEQRTAKSSVKDLCDLSLVNLRHSGSI